MKFMIILLASFIIQNVWADLSYPHSLVSYNQRLACRGSDWSEEYFKSITSLSFLYQSLSDFKVIRAKQMAIFSFVLNDYQVFITKYHDRDQSYLDLYQDGRQLVFIEGDCDDDSRSYFYRYQEDRHIGTDIYNRGEQVDRLVHFEPILGLEEVYADCLNNPEYQKSYQQLLSNTKEILITMIDSGVDYNRPEIAFAINREELVEDDFDYIDSIFSVTEESLYFHGTAVAQLLVNRDARVGIHFISERHLSSQGDSLREQIELAYQRGSRVVNISLGGKDPKDYTLLEQLMREYSDVLFVIAAGNDGKDSDDHPVYPANFELDNILTVASVSSNDQISDFSNYGQSVDIAALGSELNLIRPGHGHMILSGTSFAAPQVSRVGALLMHCQPNWSIKQIKGHILNSSPHVEGLEDVIASATVLDADSILQGCP